MARPGKKRKILFALEIIVLLVFIAGLYVYGQVDRKLEKIEQPVLNEEKIVVNAEAPKMTGYTTYALFGIDHRDKNAALGGENSDTIIIASVNNDTKVVKLVSIYRDTLLNMGDGSYSKANAAYAYGGAEQAISMLNRNLDLDIKDYVTIDFNALTTVVDLLGGLDIPLSYAEMVHLNNYCVETAEETEKEYTPLELPPEEPKDLEAIVDTYHLNGVQVTSYCRIRYTASLDMGRTERQRRVIQMIIQKGMSAGLTTIFDIMDQVFPMATTSLSKTQILQLIPSLIGYGLGETTGFPFNYKFSNVRGSIIVPTTLETNVVELHKFLYGEDTVYTPSADVLEASAKILEIVGGEEKLEDTQIVNPNAENTADDSVLWQENSDGTWNNTWSETDNGDNGSSGGGDYTDPGTSGGDNGSSGGGEYTDPGTGGGEYTDPGTGGGEATDPGTGGGGYEDPGTGGGEYVDSGDGGGDYSEDGGDALEVLAEESA